MQQEGISWLEALNFWNKGKATLFVLRMTIEGIGYH